MYSSTSPDCAASCESLCTYSHAASLADTGCDGTVA
jgi:hypothetical protein